MARTIESTEVQFHWTYSSPKVFSLPRNTQKNAKSATVRATPIIRRSPPRIAAERLIRIGQALPSANPEVCPPRNESHHHALPTRADGSCRYLCCRKSKQRLALLQLDEDSSSWHHRFAAALFQKRCGLRRRRGL